MFSPSQAWYVRVGGPCSVCKGAGKVQGESCSHCGGAGRTQKWMTVASLLLLLKQAEITTGSDHTQPVIIAPAD